ncbi:unnamed protein product [Gadus morhua 'NCC']
MDEEEREEGGPTSKRTLSGEHGRQSKAKSPEQQERADAPGPSRVSMKSHCSMEPPDQSMEPPDQSMEPPDQFKDENLPIEKKDQQERADAPGPGGFSMKHRSSKNIPPVFKDGRPCHKSRHSMNPPDQFKLWKSIYEKRLPFKMLRESDSGGGAVDGTTRSRGWRAEKGVVDTPQSSRLMEMTRRNAGHTDGDVVFILDGLDEYQPPLDFQNNPIWTDVTKPTSVDVLLTNLIRGNLLPSARIWITTRPMAANQIPAECVAW